MEAFWGRREREWRRGGERKGGRIERVAEVGVLSEMNSRAAFLSFLLFCFVLFCFGSGVSEIAKGLILRLVNVCFFSPEIASRVFGLRAGPGFR